MAKLVWSDKFSVGVRELDDQHRRLFELVNDLLAASDEGRRPEELLGLLNGLMNYNMYHLDAEEEYMEKFECVSVEHFAQHRMYRWTVRQMVEAARKEIVATTSSGFPMLRELAKFAGSWHVDHILQVDKTYTACFNDHGLG